MEILNMMKNKIQNKEFFKDYCLSKRQTILLLISIIILASFLRIYAIDRESLWADELFSVNVVDTDVNKIIETTANDTHPPLYYLILYYWMKLFGDSESSIRFPSVIFSIISVYIIYLIGKNMFNKETGILSAFILSISLFSIRYSQDARFYSLLVLMVLLSNYYFISIIQERKYGKDRNKIHIAGYIIFTTATLYTHNYGLFYLIFQNIYYIFIYRKDIRQWIFAQFSILLLFSPWIQVLKRQIILTETGKILPNISKPSIASIYDTFRAFSGNDTNLYIFILSIIIGYLIIHKYKIKYNFKNDIFLIFWLFGPILTSFILSIISHPIFREKYVIASMPALILLVSVSIYNIKKSLIILTIVIILVLSTITPIQQYYKTTEKEQWRDLVKYIEDKKKDNEFIILYPYYAERSFQYYYRNNSEYKGIINKEELKNMTINRDGIWLIYYTVSWGRLSKYKNESILIEKILSKEYTKQKTRKFIHITANYYINKTKKTV